MNIFIHQDHEKWKAFSHDTHTHTHALEEEETHMFATVGDLNIFENPTSTQTFTSTTRLR